jgi:hypothetical protein
MNYVKIKMLAQRAACLRLHLLEKYFHKINYEILSSNPNAIQLLKTKYELEKITSVNEYYCAEKISWSELSSNPSIFEEERMPIII